MYLASQETKRDGRQLSSSFRLGTVWETSVYVDGIVAGVFKAQPYPTSSNMDAFYDASSILLHQDVLQGRWSGSDGADSGATTERHQPVGQAQCCQARAVTSDQILAVVRDFFGSSCIDLDTPLLDVGLDSLAASALRESLQDILGRGVELPTSIVFEFSTSRQMFTALSGSEPPRAIASEDHSIDYSSHICMPARPALDIIDLGTTPVRASLPVVAQQSATLSGLTNQELSAGWVPQNQRLLGLLADDLYLTVWYSFSATLEAARAYFEVAPSLRTVFFKDKYTDKWRWELRIALPIYDRTCDPLPWKDQRVTFFYETSQGLMWANHTIWDSFSLGYLISSCLPGQLPKVMAHWSIHELRVSKLHVQWREGDEVVNQILREATLFEDVAKFEYAKRLEPLPYSVIQMVKRLSSRIGATLVNTWYAVIIATALQCAGKSSAPFWTQLHNRDAENMSVIGYVTSEPGFVFKTTLGMSLEHRTMQCLQPLIDVTTEHRNVFHEIASAHPMYAKFLSNSIGINVLGDLGLDDTDRSFLPEGLNLFGKMNWIEIGSEMAPLIQFHGRQDVVQFCTDVILAELVRISQSHQHMVLRAQKQTQLSVADRIALSDNANTLTDSKVKDRNPVPDIVDFAVVGAGLAG